MFLPIPSDYGIVPTKAWLLRYTFYDRKVLFVKVKYHNPYSVITKLAEVDHSFLLISWLLFEDTLENFWAQTHDPPLTQQEKSHNCKV